MDIKDLSIELLEFFYDSNDNLQLDFEAFSHTDEYRLILKEMGFLYLAEWITPARWKICSSCNKPFLSLDVSNKSKYCNYEPYRRYNKRGEPFNATSSNISNCVMIARKQRKGRF